MANSVNKVILVGNLGKDPEVRSFSNGGKVVNFSVATSESWKDKTTGEWKDRTEWNKVAVFNEHLAGQAEKYLRKGSKVYIEGQLQTRKWADKDGRDQYTTEVVLKGYDAKLVDLTPRQGGASGGRSADEDYGQYGGYGGGSSSGSGNAGVGSSPNWNSDDDGEMPF